MAEANNTPAAGGEAAAPAPAAPAAGGIDKSSLFAAIGGIDQSSGRTAGLRHVTKEMKTKPAAGTAPAKKAAKAPAAPKPKKAAPKKKPQKMEETKTGVFYENYDNAGTVENDTVKLMQQVYISGSTRTTFHIKKKFKTLALENCKRCIVVVHNVMASIEITRCQGCKVQVLNSCPTMSIDQSDGTKVYLTNESKSIKILTSKISDTNVTVPGATEDDDVVEHPIPEQFQHVFGESGALETSVSDLYHS